MKKELKQLEEALTQIQKYQMDEPDHEGEMAKSQMLKTMKYAADIMNMIDDTTNLPAWVQSKLTKIADYIGAVKHYMDSKTVRHIVTNMGEGVERKSEEIRLVDMVPVNSRRESVKESVNEEIKVGSSVTVNYPTLKKPIKGKVKHILKSPTGLVYVLGGDKGVWDAKNVSLKESVNETS